MPIDIYGYVAAKVVETPSILEIFEVVTKLGIMVGNPSNLSIFLVGPEERICNYFEECSFPMYECLFTMLSVHLLFYYFKVDIMDHLKVVPCNFISELGLL